MRTYDTPGKRANRELLLNLARLTGVRTYGTFWGHGVDSRLFAPEFDVIACEVREAKHLAMAEDGAAHGYRVHMGRGGSLVEHVDMFFADFDGTASPGNFEETERIAAITDQWLAVTLSNAHKLDQSLQGRAACYTVPAWLTGASGFTLEYLNRYVSEGGQTMWFSILRRKGGRGTHQQVLPIQIERSIRERAYWSSRSMYGTGLMRHRQEPRTPLSRVGDARRYLAKKALRPVRHALCRRCGSQFDLPQRRGRPPTTCSTRCRDEARAAYRREWYLAAVSGTAAEAIFSEKAA